MSKTAVKKTAKKAVPVNKRAAPAKKAAPGRSAPKKAKAPPPARKKPAPAHPVAKKIVAKKALPAKKPVAKTAAPAKVAKPAPAKAPAKADSLKKAAPPPAPRPAPAPAPATAKVAPPAVASGAAIATPNGFVPRKPGRGTPKYFVAPVQAPLPPPTSRFADRFAPPRPPTRQMNKEENDTPREKHKADPKLANAWKTKAGRDLSDDEVLAMPDAEYMNEKQLEFFRMKLQALKDDLLSNAGETTEHLREDTSIVPDPADRATIEEEHALELRTRDRERKLLKKISQSLGRIESGEYGFCDETGEPIGLGRLIARPTATLSLEAQQRRELKQKMFGD